ncbi:MAG: type III pantothenate kinase [Myxococcales bacterium]|nr:type III pantothenate kinase [Myxococcales bacterium]
MLLVVDIGNTNTVLGVYRQAELLDHFRLESRRGATADEMAVLTTQLLDHKGFKTQDVAAAVIASVVPQLTPIFTDVCQRVVGRAPLVVGPGTRTGMPILIDNPREVGADRIVNAIAAFELYKGPCIVVDFGTATTFDVINGKGQYLGGVIAPGIGISADALFARAAKLPRVEIQRPPSVIGKTTVHAIQAGLLWGYAGLVDGLVARLKSALGEPAKVCATGGLAPLIATEAPSIEQVLEFLTLDGLRLVWERNREV